MTQNAIPSDSDVATRIASRRLTQRGDDYANEVRRILDAALALMRERGTTSKPRVADIVAKAGVSNDVFYRYFPSKDALVMAILDDGSQRLTQYVSHQLAKAATPEEQVRRWVESVLSQADEDTAATTLAVLWNGGGVGEGSVDGRHFSSASIAALLTEPFVALGSAAPAFDAALAAHAVLGKLSDYLWQRTTPSQSEIEHIVAFCLRVPQSTQAPPERRR